ncbi:MAG TPA: hypothetical protein VFQ61_04135 [Polyangiaceae bacterium]|nr:hypothetical protein [Polyangiaceae bacterium]
MKYRALVGLLLPILACSSKETNPVGGGGQSPGIGGATASGGTSNSAGSGGSTSPAGASQGGSTTSMSGGQTASGGGNNTSSGGKATTGGASVGGSSGGTTSMPTGGATSDDGGSGGVAGGAAGGTPSASDSVLERNNSPSRDGHFVRPDITRAKAAEMMPDAAFKATFKGSMFASPLYAADGPGGKGAFFAATTGNDVFALDATTGATLWTKNIGSAPSATGASGALCGNIRPVGILSTPVIDPTTRTIYVAGAIGTTRIERHEIHALSLDDGKERDGWPIDATKIAAGTVKMDPVQPYNQRSALSLVNGVLYVAYGGHIGDCPVYHGWVTAIDTKDPTKTGAWATAGEGEAIWAAGGLASDGSSVYAATGNSTNGVSDRTKSDSEAVVKLTGLAKFERNNANTFYPANWRTLDQQDADLGGSNPVFFSLGASKYLATIGKNGHMFLLDPANLGGSDGHKVDFQIADGGAMAVKTVPTVYKSAQGVNIAFSVDSSAVGCPAGGPMGARMTKMVMSVSIPQGSPPSPKVAWCAALSGNSTAPITTTTDGSADSIVWYVNNGKLSGVNGDTGQVIYTSSDTCSGVQRWTSPIAVGKRVVAGGDGKLCAWTVK